MGPSRSTSKRHMRAERKPTRGIADLGKVIFVFDISYLFSAGTIGTHPRA